MIATYASMSNTLRMFRPCSARRGGTTQQNPTPRPDDTSPTLAGVYGVLRACEGTPRLLGIGSRLQNVGPVTYTCPHGRMRRPCMSPKERTTALQAGVLSRREFNHWIRQRVPMPPLKALELNYRLKLPKVPRLCASKHATPNTGSPENGTPLVPGLVERAGTARTSKSLLPTRTTGVKGTGPFPFQASKAQRSRASRRP